MPIAKISPTRLAVIPLSIRITLAPTQSSNVQSQGYASLKFGSVMGKETAMMGATSLLIYASRQLHHHAKALDAARMINAYHMGGCATAAMIVQKGRMKAV